MDPVELFFFHISPSSNPKKIQNVNGEDKSDKKTLSPVDSHRKTSLR